MPIDEVEAERAIEQLRFGVPPTGMARAFTVGREEQISELERSLDDGEVGGALLIHANYGGGKSHLLRVLRELALERSFAVSAITADAQGGVRFNRMDTIFGAVCRQLEVPGIEGKGVGTLFDRYAAVVEDALTPEYRQLRNEISAKGRWDFAERLDAPALFVALRAWVHSKGKPGVRQRVEAWLSEPEKYRGQRRLLYNDLVLDLRGAFRDPRAEWQFYSEGVFIFNLAGHRQAWDGLRDLDTIAKCSELRGLVLLVDEFEDVIQNLARRDLQQAAFHNLFRFFANDRFKGRSYFAVTPDFAMKCKKELLGRGIYDFDYARFDSLPYFQLDPIEIDDLNVLARRIRALHSIAYGWDAKAAVGDRELKSQCDALMKVQAPDRVRQAIIGIVQLLDAQLEAD